VFAGACHFNGEVTTAGREAMMAWNFTSGKWQDIDLTGVRLMAIVSSDTNLSETNTSRQSEIIVDSSVTRAKALAALNALKEKYPSALGNIVKMRFAPINFVHSGKTYEVTSDGATINVEAMPNDLCCKMPNLVWYTPLVGLENRKVGYTTKALYDGNGVGEPWSRSDENSAFYGSFAF
jgi:roadblock/LC7 domain-containing protein